MTKKMKMHRLRLIVGGHIITNTVYILILMYLSEIGYSGKFESTDEIIWLVFMLINIIAFAITAAINDYLKEDTNGN